MTFQKSISKQIQNQSQAQANYRFQPTINRWNSQSNVLVSTNQQRSKSKSDHVSYFENAIKSNHQVNLFKLGNLRSGCPISRAGGKCIKRPSIPDRIGIQKCWFFLGNGVTQTKINTSLGFTSQLDLQVKPTSMPCLFLIGGVMSNEPNQSRDYFRQSFENHSIKRGMLVKV